MTIPFETGIPSLLKEKGFNWPTNHYMNETVKAQKDKYHKGRLIDRNIYPNQYSMPDYDQVLDWLEEKRGIVIYNVPIEVYPDVLRWEPAIFGHDSIMFTMYNTRYEALNEGIKEGLKLIKK